MSSIDNKINVLWKNIIYNKAETDINKLPSEEIITYRPAVLSEQVYNASKLIPIPANELVNVCIFQSIKCISDPNSDLPHTWIAIKDETKDVYNIDNRLFDWISPSIDVSYNIRVYVGDPSNNVKINPSEYEFIFDYANGILFFIDTIPSLTDSIYITGYRYIGSKGISSGDSLILGTPTDGSLTDTVEKTLAIKTWTSKTTITDAIDDLNETLSFFVPDPPPGLQGNLLFFSDTIKTISGDFILLSDNYTNNSSYYIQPGTNVSLITKNNTQSNTIEKYGNGQSGSLTLFINGSVNSMVYFDNTDKTGIHGSLIIVDNSQYPLDRPPVFFRSISSHIELYDLPIGVSTIELVHSETGTTGVFPLVYDNLNTLSMTSNINVSEFDVKYRYSSSIPHYDNGSILKIDTGVRNLVNQVYLSGTLFQISSDPIIGNEINLSADDINGGILPARMPYKNISEKYTISGNVHTQSYIIARGKNIVGDEDWNYSGIKINVMSGDVDYVVENSIPVINMPNIGNVQNNDPAYRIKMSGGDMPNDSFMNWNSTDSLMPYDAVVVGGILKNDKTNYSNCLPVGPDLSNHNNDQYASFLFHRKGINKFDIDIEGSYSGIFVKLSDMWFDLTKLYGNGNGCAEGIIANGAGIFRVNFGKYNSSTYDGNAICVRIKLSTGQFITKLRFVGVNGN